MIAPSHSQHRDLDGIHYWTYGVKDAQPLLLIHGFTGSHEGFQYLVPTLEKKFYIVIPDLPGFGSSNHAQKPWTIDSIAKQTNEFVSKLQLPQKPIVLSHSMGGLVAASMLTQNPELFAKKTIFLSPVASRIKWLDSRKIGALAGRLQFFVGYKIPRVGPHVLRSRILSRAATSIIMTTKDKALRETINQHHFKNLDYISSAKYYHDLHVNITGRGALDYSEGLKSYDVKIITGDSDNVTPLKDIQRLAHELSAELTIVPGVGHLAHYETPKAILKALSTYLA